MQKVISFDSIEKGFDFRQAYAEANRCLLCYDPPCSKGCPGGTDPGTFIRKFRMRNITGAIKTIKSNNILGITCGILCPTAQLCEKECSATEIDRPVSIGKIQRFLMEYAWQDKFNFLDYQKATGKNKSVAVIGSGPAGLTCAAELSKNGYNVTVFEARPEAGGVLRYGVPEHRFPLEYLKKEIESVASLGVNFKFNSPVNDENAAENMLKSGFDAVFIATGLWKPQNVVDKKVDGVFSSVDFLSMMRENKSEILKNRILNKKVAVIGGGSVAMDCVETSVKLGAKDVYLIYRRSYIQMPAEDDEKLHVLNAGTHLLLLNQPVDYISENGFLRSVVLRRVELGEIDAGGRRQPVEIPGSDWKLDVDVVVEAAGNSAVDDAHKAYPSVKLGKNKLIVIDPETCATSVEGIYAGGDIAYGPSLIIKAVRDGKKAAAAINNYIQNKEK